jgi:hypothetical protein
MATSRGWWKQRERDGAALFGTKRKPGSGSWGRSDQTSSDSMHDRLYIEQKTREKHSVRTLWEETKVKAKKEGKVPVLVLWDKGRQGPLVVMHEDDQIYLAAERAFALGFTSKDFETLLQEIGHAEAKGSQHSG